MSKRHALAHKKTPISTMKSGNMLRANLFKLLIFLLHNKLTFIAFYVLLAPKGPMARANIQGSIFYFYILLLVGI